jgi:drug/metabolite transporter (DMT)-like permease
MIVATTGVLWGFYWLPVRHMAILGWQGPWGTAAITAAAALGLMPFAMRQMRALGAAHWSTLAVLVMGGGAFALYSIGFVYGRVALVILLFFLTPIWSTLLARFVMGWHTPTLRYLAIAIGLVGLGLMLSAGGTAPIPKSLGEWLGLISGVLWSVTTTVLRARPAVPPVPAAWLFAMGACVTALVMAVVLEPMPDQVTMAQVATAVITGGLWWGVSIAALMWAVMRLDPARVGILLMSEVLIGTVGAALIAGEVLTAIEVLGGGLVLLAGVLEVWPQAEPRTEK